MKRLLILVAACSAPAAPIANVASTAPPVSLPSACPTERGPWIREMFPQCPTAPFDTFAPVCLHDCPMPCAATEKRDGKRMREQTFAYDAKGAGYRRRATDRHGPAAATTASTWLLVRTTVAIRRSFAMALAGSRK